MMGNDQELQATQQRLAHCEGLLAQLRVSATPEEYPLVASSYRAEIVRMRDDVLACLTRRASRPAPAETF